MRSQIAFTYGRFPDLVAVAHRGARSTFSTRSTSKGSTARPSSSGMRIQSTKILAGVRMLTTIISISIKASPLRGPTRPTSCVRSNFVLPPHRAAPWTLPWAVPWTLYTMQALLSSQSLVALISNRMSILGRMAKGTTPGLATVLGLRPLYLIRLRLPRPLPPLLLLALFLHLPRVCRLPRPPARALLLTLSPLFPRVRHPLRPPPQASPMGQSA